eukprot:340466_1
MAYSAIFVLIFSKLISAIAIQIKDKNILRTLLQVLDLLIFIEIYETHNKVVSQLKSRKLKDKDAAIESTLSFKIVRSYEAVFESIPEAVLQLVYVIRISSIEWIFMLSIFQSIVSMTNSILNNDHTQMQDAKWDKYKKRLPPTIHCLKHSVFRLCEVLHRIGLLALLWTVCGGEVYVVFLAIELAVLIWRSRYLVRRGQLELGSALDPNILLLCLTSFIIIPSEFFYAYDEKRWHHYARVRSKKNDATWCSILCCLVNCFFCPTLCGFVTGWTGIIKVDPDAADAPVHFIPLTRICVSFFEFMTITVWALASSISFDEEFPFISMSFEGNVDGRFLFSFDYGAGVFIASCVGYIVYTQYLIFFPNFALPFGVNVRSKWGYALANELSELQRISVPHTKFPYTLEDHTYIIRDGATFWDQPMEYQGGVPVTAAMIAVIQGHTDIVQWLEDRGATSHQIIADKVKDYLMLAVDLDAADKFSSSWLGDLEAMKKLEIMRKIKAKDLMSLQDVNIWDNAQAMDSIEFERFIQMKAGGERKLISELFTDLETFKRLNYIAQGQFQILDGVSDDTNHLLEANGILKAASRYGIHADLTRILARLRVEKASTFDPELISRDIKRMNAILLSKSFDDNQSMRLAALYRIGCTLNSSKGVRFRDKRRLIEDLESYKSESREEWSYYRGIRSSFITETIPISGDLKAFLVLLLHDIIKENASLALSVRPLEMLPRSEFKQNLRSLNDRLLNCEDGDDLVPIFDDSNDETQSISVKVYIKTEAHFYDEPVGFVQSFAMTPAVFALSRGHYSVTKWLEDKGALSHKSITPAILDNWDWDEVSKEEEKEPTFSEI